MNKSLGQSDINYFSVPEWAKIKGLEINKEQIKTLENLADRFSKDEGLPVNIVENINTYHINILTEIMEILSVAYTIIKLV